MAALVIVAATAIAAAGIAFGWGRAARAARRADKAQYDQRVDALEAGSRLAADLAHDLDDLLTAVIGQAELLMAGSDPSAAQSQGAREIRDAALKAARLTRPLRSVGGIRPSSTDVIDVNDVITTAAGFLRRKLGSGIEVKLMLDPAVKPIRIGAGRLDALVLTLGIGVNLTALRLLLLEITPIVRDPDTLVEMDRWFPDGRGTTIAYPVLAFYAEHNRSFRAVIATHGESVVFGQTASGQLPEIVNVNFVTPNYFTEQAPSIERGRALAAAPDELPGAEPAALHLDGVLVDDRGRGVDDVLHVELFFRLPVHDRVRVRPARLEQLDDFPDAGPLFVERGIPQPPLHVPGQVEFAGAFGEQVMRDARLVRARPAEKGPRVDGQLAAAPGAQER